MASQHQPTLTLNAKALSVESTSSHYALIASSAVACNTSLERCANGSTVVDARRQSAIEDQIARFSIWTSNMGDFARPNLSLDRRLRDAVVVRDIVVGLLVLGVPDRHELLAAGEFEGTLLDIANEITLLNDLANTIRRAGRKSQDERAPKNFVLKSVDGSELEHPLKKAWADNILDRFPDCSEVIRSRLAATMVLRRKRILYRWSRYASYPIRPVARTTKPVRQPPLSLTPEYEQPLHVQGTCHETAAPIPANKVLHSAQSTAMKSATTLAIPAFEKAQAPTVVSKSRTIALSAHEGLVFPPPPGKNARDRQRRLRSKSEQKIEPQSTSVTGNSSGQNFADDPHVDSYLEVICPFCLEHVKNDLDSYVCLFEECDEAEKLWTHSEAWLKHMRKHAQRWRCPAKSHRDQQFETQEAFRAHLVEDHKKIYTDAELAMLINRSRKASEPLFSSYPLCGETAEQAPGKLEQHITGHLRSLALKSLPPVYDEEEENEISEQRSAGAASNRSTINALYEMGTPIHFEDPDPSSGSSKEKEHVAKEFSNPGDPKADMGDSEVRPAPSVSNATTGQPTRKYTTEDFHGVLEKANETWMLASADDNHALVTHYLDEFKPGDRADYPLRELLEHAETLFPRVHLGETTEQLTDLNDEAMGFLGAFETKTILDLVLRACEGRAGQYFRMDTLSADSTVLDARPVTLLGPVVDALASMALKDSQLHDLMIRPGAELAVDSPTGDVQGWTVYHCVICSRNPDGFASAAELQRHTDAEHHTVRRFVCRDPANSAISYLSNMSAQRPLSDCRHCAHRREYTTWDAAAAHLRRSHFRQRVKHNPRCELPGDGDDESGRSVAWPPVTELTLWIEDVHILRPEQDPASFVERPSSASESSGKSSKGKARAE
ncbi:protein phosphatase-1 [Purpureocillium lavendulum]|uniref:Protein phosphatase-1 n=1 Tax=Purpureocillium lavendulum TaxID=1247861 RepID=A0AB34FX46_9HYPO|nr:protein phosphatase-1 [Purpureocillium lavendulum]